MTEEEMKEQKGRLLCRSPCMVNRPCIALRTPRKHIVPTHLQMPDQVLTLWSFSLTARQLLLLLVGGGIGGTVWQHLMLLGHYAVPGQVATVAAVAAAFPAGPLHRLVPARWPLHRGLVRGPGALPTASQTLPLAQYPHL